MERDRTIVTGGRAEGAHGLASASDAVPIARTKTAFTLIMEMENGALVPHDELVEILAALERELASPALATTGSARAQVIFVQEGSPQDGDVLSSMLRTAVPALATLADVEVMSVPGGRYYELRNAAVPRALGELVLFLDSDAVPQPGWLAKMLAPFEDRTVTLVNGFTALEHDDFLSRAYALFWVFPLARGDERFAAKRSLNVNNCAFRRAWIAAHPFPDNNGFKVSCSLLWDQIRRDGVVTRRVDALALHKPPRGLRFLVWRALVTGRDNDRRYRVLKSTSRPQRLRHSLGRLWTAEWRSLRRVFGKGRYVGMPIWEQPAAFLLASAFHSLAFFSQVAMAAGLVRDEVERLPAYVVRS